MTLREYMEDVKKRIEALQPEHNAIIEQEIQLSERLKDLKGEVVLEEKLLNKFQWKLSLWGSASDKKIVLESTKPNDIPDTFDFPLSWHHDSFEVIKGVRFVANDWDYSLQFDDNQIAVNFIIEQKLDVTMTNIQKDIAKLEKNLKALKSINEMLGTKKSK